MPADVVVLWQEAAEGKIQHAFEEHGQVEVALVKNKRTGQQQDIMGRTTTNISKGRGQGVDRSSGEQGRSQGSVLGSSDTVGLKSNQQHTLMSSPIEEGSDGDDVSSCRVASTKRGGSSQVQVPEPVNREWIYIIDGEFSNQITATRIIGVNLKGMWSGPWKSWKDVPNEDKKRLFERFHCYFQWEEKWNGEIYSCWEQCIAGKIPDLLGRVRDQAKETAKSKDVLVEDDMSVLTDFKPPWIKTETWKQMIEIWNTPEWKAKSKRNKKIRTESKGGKHTLGSQTYATAKRKVAEIIGREPAHSEMWKQTHLRKGSRPFDKDLDCSSSVVENVDLEDVDLEGVELEGNVQEKKSAWVDDRAHDTWVKYEGLLLEKYGEESSQHRELDKELWYRAAGGKKRGKVYGLSNLKNDFNVQHHGKQDQEIERLNVIIAGLVVEKEKDKAEKEAMNERMANIEAMLKSRFQNV
ncbi:putative transposase, Ptta/En/Spm, plant [Helianthus annuus]|nr:putative transposase, Ptta/En/Spm, plant [Helianthus annuus]